MARGSRTPAAEVPVVAAGAEHAFVVLMGHRYGEGCTQRSQDDLGMAVDTLGEPC